MTMYFVNKPNANQLLKACYSLAILTLVLAISGGGRANCSTSETTTMTTNQPDERAPDTQRHAHRDHLLKTWPAAAAASSPVEGAAGGRQQPLLVAANNFNLNNINLINYDDDTKAGAKSLEGEKKVEVKKEFIEQGNGPLESRAGQRQQTSGGNDEKGPQTNKPTSKLETLHKLMSENDLRRTFQVETHDQVPEYQVLKLTVSQDGSHLISPISDLGELLITTSTTNTNQRHGTNDGGGHKVGAELAGDQGNIETSAIEAKAHNQPDASDAQDSGSQQTRIKRSATEAASASDAPAGQRRAANDEDERVLVMNLNTFGQDFSLRLKRNADFQQRIKDMKMFLAESTGDGQLLYTEIKQPNGQQQQHHRKQEPHKRAADSAADSLEDSHKQSASDKNKPTANSTAGGAAAAADGTPKGSAADWHNIGSTYHDEENLAALLIERDRRTGQIQVDGTIGNDFVIKPMPRATIEALLAAKDNDGPSALSSNTIKASAAATANSPTSNELKQAASHMHDEDPHDDDEMFLDEDEALELANLNGTSVAQRAQTNSTLAPLPQQQQRALSKAASERKWRKHRKLMAQIQVPKLQAGQSQEARARRQAQVGAQQQQQQHQDVNSRDHTTNSSPEHFHMSHHIVYRQKPSSESSSSEHKHSFMFAPGQQNMEQLARSFSGPQQPGSKLTDGDNMIEEEGAAASRLYLARDGVRFGMGAAATDHAHDPLGGQFYLEPGSVTGFERAGYSDWSLVSPSGRRSAFPPYTFNSSEPSGNATLALDEEAWPSDRLGNSTSRKQRQQHARFKRHLGGGSGPRHSPRLVGASSHRPAHASASAPRGRRHKRQAPDVVWPEVLLVVDYDSFLLHGGDSREVKRYFVSFWNGVDLRYKLLVNPHIRISLAGMIVAKDRDATPYLERNRLRAPNADAVDAAGALTDMGKYLYREDRLPTYDLAVVITKLDMCRRRYEGGRCNRGTAGFAYVGGACVVNKRLEKVNSVAIIEDSGGFSGIIVAAHEVGHLLGCVHDGSPPPSYLGGPGATHCPWEDGFIMSDLRHTERGFRWSQCSVEQFKHFLNGETATCLYNYPHESQMLHRLLPGSMLSLDDQCKRDRGTNACFKDARVCAQLFCFDSASGYCVSYRPAAEGSPCGDGHVCRNGKCVGEIENIIPDYTHQSQTVVAATGQRQRALAAGQPIPSAAATASVVSALAVPRLTSAPVDSLSTSSSSTSSAAALENGVSSKLVASTATTAPAKSERRMDTFQVDTPLQQLPINYHNQRQASSQPPFQHNSNLNHNHQLQQQQQQQQQRPQQRHPKAAGPRLKTTTTTSVGSFQRGAAAELAVGLNGQQRELAAYSDAFAYSPQRKLTPTSTTASGHLMRSSEPLFAAGSTLSAASPTTTATRRVQQRASVSFAVPIQRQLARTRLD